MEKAFSNVQVENNTVEIEIESCRDNQKHTAPIGRSDFH